MKVKFQIPDSDIESSISKDYDIKIVLLCLTFEVKNDLMAEKTGNIAVEYESRARASGLSSTTADFWVDKFLGVYYIVEISRIYNKNSWKELTGEDWRSNTKMYLVKIPIFASGVE